MKSIQEEIDDILLGCTVNENDPTVKWLRLLSSRVSILERCAIIMKPTKEEIEDNARLNQTA